VIPKAKPTIYKEHRYRSRTEARWAYYLDLIGIQYIPDPQSISIRFDDSLFGFPTNYIPDFRFQNHNSWAEVKGAVELTPTEKAKVIGLVSGTGEPCFVLQGIPQVKPFAEDKGIIISRVVSDATERKVVLSYIKVKGDLLTSIEGCECGSQLEMTAFCNNCFDSEISEAVNKVAWKRNWEGVDEEGNSELSSLMNW
jgi:hypothetical protein